MVPPSQMPGVPHRSSIVSSSRDISSSPRLPIVYRNATKTLHFKFPTTAKNTVVPSPSTCWLLSQQRHTRWYSSATRWYLTSTLGCRTTRIIFFLICLVLPLRLCPYDTACALWDPWPRLLRRPHSSVVPLLTSEIVNPSQSFSPKRTRQKSEQTS